MLSARTDVKFDLASFRPVIKKGIVVTVGFSANVSTQLSLSNMTEAVTVTGESPIVDTKQTGTKQTFTTEMLQSIPSARDPWVILQQTAGIAMDRENIGGNMSGQQSNFVSRGASPGNTKWSVDGIDTTDMAATGASPTYYDFDAFQEMTINTGGVDVSQQTSGVGVNLVTKSGTNRFKGSGRFFQTNDRYESNNITEAQRTQGATSGNPIQDVKDFGTEMGGPLKKGRAWIWGSYGKQDINVGVLGFYKPTADCQAFKSSAVALASPIKDINNCLNADTTLLVNTNLKAEVQLFSGNKLSLFNSLSKKDRNARNASDLRPIETTSRQSAVPSTFGRKGWITGPSPTYKFGDQWVISDRLLVDMQYAHVGNNFILDFHEDALKDVQPTFIISNSLNGRSASQSVFLRPVNSFNVNANYFLPSRLGADHALKFGGYWRDAYSESIGHTGGNATVRFPNSVDDDCSQLSTGCQVAVTRDSHTVYDLTNVSLFAQDTITRGKATVQIGVRWDRNHDRALGASIPASPLLPDWLPAVEYSGIDPKIIFNDISPRLGITYDLTGDGRTILRGNYARYYGQVGTAGVSGSVNPLSGVTVRYPWVDANGDKVAQTSEILASSKPLATSGNWSATDPTFVGTQNTVDPNLKNDTTDEVIVGASREIGRSFAVDVNYIWRRYGNFSSSRRNGITSADYVEASFTPTASQCSVPGARCDTVTYFYPSFQAPNVTTLSNTPDFSRSFNGVEITGRKRMANRWMMNTSFSYNSIIQNYDSAAAYVESDEHRAAQRLSVRLRDGRLGHRERLRQRQVAVQTERSLSAAVRLQRVRVLQRAAGLSLRAGRARRQPAERRRHRRRAAGSGRREPPAELPESRPALRASDRRGTRPLRPVARRLQRHEREHRPGDAGHPERIERQQHPGHRRAARPALRRPRELVVARLRAQGSRLRAQGSSLGRISFKGSAPFLVPPCRRPRALYPEP